MAMGPRISRFLQAGALVGVLWGAAMQPLHAGAVYTSTAGGTIVNGNLYTSKTDVFLNGGPQPPACNGPGLGDGTYYFVVTDPSGNTILSNDAQLEREIQVVGGKMAIYLGSTHVVNAGGGCPGGIAVGLAPFDDTPNHGGEYKISFIAISPANNTKSDNFKIRCKVDCGDDPTPQAAITGVKWYDLNTDGVLDPTEVGIGGWRIESNPAPLSSSPTYTNAGGTYSFVVSPNSGSYTISEVAPTPGFVPTPGAVWANTTPISGQVTVFGSDVAGPNFGNVCLGTGNGFTLGYWSNKNGQAVLQSQDVAWRTELNALCLRRANGLDYDVPGGAFSTAYPDFRTWILGANATNMAYMLSAQLTAMKLSTLYKGAGGMVFAGTAPSGCSPAGLQANGFISVANLMAAANTELCAHPNTTASGVNRSCQEFLKTTLDNGNNNKNFVQPGPDSCPFTSPY